MVVGTVVSVNLAIDKSKAEKRVTGINEELTKEVDIRRNGEYAADMLLANRLIEEGNISYARNILSKYTADKDFRDLRGIEYQLLWKKTEPDYRYVIEEANHVFFSPDSKFYLAVKKSESGHLELDKFDIKNGKLVETISIHDPSINTLKNPNVVVHPNKPVLGFFSKNNKDNKNILIYDWESNKLLKTIKISDNIKDILFSPKKDMLLVHSWTMQTPQKPPTSLILDERDHRLNVIDITTSKLLYTKSTDSKKSEYISDFTFTKNAEWLVFKCQEGIVSVGTKNWKTQSDDILYNFILSRVGLSGRNVKIANTNEPNTIYITDDNSVTKWDIAKNESVDYFSLKNDDYSVQIFHNLYNNQFCIYEGSKLAVRSSKDGSLTHYLLGSSDRVFFSASSRNGRWIATNSQGKWLIWDISNKSSLFSFESSHASFFERGKTLIGNNSDRSGLTFVRHNRPMKPNLEVWAIENQNMKLVYPASEESLTAENGSRYFISSQGRYNTLASSISLKNQEYTELKMQWLPISENSNENKLILSKYNWRNRKFEEHILDEKIEPRYEETPSYFPKDSGGFLNTNRPFFGFSSYSEKYNAYAIGATNGEFLMYSVSEAKLAKRYRILEKEYELRNLKFSPNSRYLIFNYYISNESILKSEKHFGLYDFESKEFFEVKELSGFSINSYYPRSQGSNYIFSPNQEMLAISNRNEIIIFDLTHKKITKRFRTHREDLRTLHFSSMGNTMISITEKGIVSFYNTSNCRLMAELELESGRIPRKVYVSPNSDFIIFDDKILEFPSLEKINEDVQRGWQVL